MTCEIKEAGPYHVFESPLTEDYTGNTFTVLVSGQAPFLKFEMIWDNQTNEPTTTDVFRGKNWRWEKINR